MTKFCEITQEQYDALIFAENTANDVADLRVLVVGDIFFPSDECHFHESGTITISYQAVELAAQRGYDIFNMKRG